jgi:thioredoxin-like negative regulator of GroEL
MRLEYFTAPWCQPCKTFGPIVEKVNHFKPGLIEKIDIQKNPERLPNDVLGIPTVIMYNGNTEVARFSGAKSESELLDWISVNG